MTACQIAACPEPAVTSGWCEFHSEWAQAEYQRAWDSVDHDGIAAAVRAESREALVQAAASHLAAVDAAFASVVTDAGSLGSRTIVQVRCGHLARGSSSRYCGKPLAVVAETETGPLLYDLREQRPVCLPTWDSWPHGIAYEGVIGELGIDPVWIRCAAKHRRRVSVDAVETAVKAGHDRILA